MSLSFEATFRLGHPEPTYLWLVDIAGFSQVRDDAAHQELLETLFSCVYRAVEETAGTYANDERLSSDDATVIWLGDGAIVAMKAPFDHLAPLRLTARFRHHWCEAPWVHYRRATSAGIPQLHVAAHCGECRWLRTPTLRSPLFECSNCFGVDLNVLTRLAVFSGPDEYICSEELIGCLKLPGGLSTIDLGKGFSMNFDFDIEPQTGSVGGKGPDQYTYRRFAMAEGR